MTISQRKKNIQTWVDVGFLPMPGLAALNPKVRHELGEGGAPPEAGERLKLLVDDYTRQALELTSLGFNGDLLDLEPPSVVNTSIPDGEEAQIQYLLANGKVTKAGGLFKAGVHLANGRVVNEVHRRQGLFLLRLVNAFLGGEKIIVFVVVVVVIVVFVTIAIR